MYYDVLIIGGGAAGMSCALVLGSARNKPFASDKKIGIIMHQKSSALENGLFNNVLGISPGTTGKEILENGINHLASVYPHVHQIEREKVLKIVHHPDHFQVITNRNEFSSKIVVVAVGPSNLFSIKGLMHFVEPHRNLPPKKQRIQLRNRNHKVEDNIYVAGVLAGWRSQLAIAAGSGAQVATDILTVWNDGNTTMIHDTME